MSIQSDYGSQHWHIANAIEVILASYASFIHVILKILRIK